ncbi:MAG: DUF3127 domain-containing protein [Bacteroidales bacterium]|jgi:hypothetical protein|nr:DUF3127 domain-containing protein [Bacteroidales bacterium]HOL97761.1 DUF3127 domain-containing protein [Bacteroidales bacterium]HOM37315.1 DUF3127 domain-containing protein [Bacteroidales bacterium]HPD24741.1 DUF3127 domain-containing protein [Bacteroidales bacterium]HRT00486.1 DUF3127 domain-containing protein [Bacteroidales bacterium]
MEITGKLISKLPPITGEGKNGQWKKQNFVIETISDFPKKICFVVWQDKADLSSVVESDIVRVYFDIESREYNGNWFTDLKCWKIELDKPGTGEQYQPPAFLNTEDINIVDIDIENDPGDDLPF